ncbi:MAG: VPLPA-CTERM sorting domain-containing protein [Smithella sp.]|jgi:hypothetical protein
MKKKLFLIAATFMLMFSFAGQAMAAFAQGDLIQVIYTVGGPEVATDLGSFSATSSGSVTDSGNLGNTVNFSTLFNGYSESQLNVAYFIYGGPTVGAWVTGADGGQTNVGGQKSTLQSDFTAVLNYYKGINGTATQVAGTTTNGASYWYKLDSNGTHVGAFAGFLTTPNGEAQLSSSGYVDLFLYYYPTGSMNVAGSGTEIADIRTFADGSTEIIPLVSTPLPAAVWLLGSGLMCLVGIRRRGTVA